MGILNLFSGTSKKTFSIGDGADKILLKNNLGVLEPRNYNDSDFVEIRSSNVTDRTNYEVGLGKEFPTFTDALTAIKNKIYQKDVVITIEPGTYSEIIDFSSFIGQKLTIRGDTRELIGFGYSNGKAITTDVRDDYGVSYATTNSGQGTISLVNAGNDIDVTCSVANPDFLASGIVAGDKIVIHDDAGVFHELTIAAVTATKLTLTTPAPAVITALAGFSFMPNVVLNQQTKFSLINNLAFQGVHFAAEGLSFTDHEKIDVRKCTFSGSLTMGARINGNRINGQIIVLQCGFFQSFLRCAIKIIYSGQHINWNNLFFSAIGINNANLLHCESHYNKFVKVGAFGMGYFAAFGEYSSINDIFLNYDNAMVFATRSVFSINGTLVDGGQKGIQAQSKTYGSILSATVQNMTTVGVEAIGNSYIDVVAIILAGNLADYSPAFGVIGNDESKIY